MWWCRSALLSIFRMNTRRLGFEGWLLQSLADVRQEIGTFKYYLSMINSRKDFPSPFLTHRDSTVLLVTCIITHSEHRSYVEEGRGLHLLLLQAFCHRLKEKPTVDPCIPAVPQSFSSPPARRPQNWRRPGCRVCTSHNEKKMIWSDLQHARFKMMGNYQIMEND